MRRGRINARLRSIATAHQTKWLRASLNVSALAEKEVPQAFQTAKPWTIKIKGHPDLRAFIESRKKIARLSVSEALNACGIRSKEKRKELAKVANFLQNLGVMGVPAEEREKLVMQRLDAALDIVPKQEYLQFMKTLNEKTKEFLERVKNREKQLAERN